MYMYHPSRFTIEPKGTCVVYNNILAFGLYVSIHQFWGLIVCKRVAVLCPSAYIFQCFFTVEECGFSGA